MKKTIVLYNPDAVFYTMPLALLAIASVIDLNKYNVEIIDARIDKNALQTIKEKLSNNGVCFACTVLTGSPIKDAIKASKFVKLNYPSVTIIWGGWHPSLFPEQTLKEDYIDIVVKGQGELTFLELLNALDNQLSLYNIKGISFKENRNIIHNAERTMVDINTFATLNYNLINVKAYTQLSGQNQLDYISSQGCRFRCTFCADPFMYKRGWYGYEPSRMVEEISSLWETHQFKHVHFQDETFFTNSKRVKTIAQGFIDAKLPITWFGTIRADQGVRLDEDVWGLCKKSGLKKVMIGMEAGTQEMLDWMKKDIKLHHIFDTAQKCKKYNIAINFSIIVGFPNESDESVNETLRIAKELRKMSYNFSVNIFYFKPYPGNPIADELLKSGYQFQNNLQEWSDFDYVGTNKSVWLNHKQINEIENFKFYQQLAYNKPTVYKYVFQKLAQWRIENNYYIFPFEKTIKEWLKPSQKLS